jgi:carotenoid cleavage dioxygenase-like enzyme
VHAAKAEPSSAHSNVAPASDEKLKLGLASLLGFVGALVIDALGAAVSTDHVELAAAPVLPNASIALTWNVWLPSARPV